MYRCESWTIKKAEHQRIDAFELWCWRRLLRVPWTARRSNQSFLKEINLEYSSEGLMLRLKCQYFGHLMWRANSLEKTLMLGKIEGKRRRGWQRTRWLNGITDSMDMSLSKLWKIMKEREPGMLQSSGLQRVRRELSDWITTTNQLLQILNLYSDVPWSLFNTLYSFVFGYAGSFIAGWGLSPLLVAAHRFL